LSPSEYGLVTIFVTLMVAFSALAGLSVHGAVNVRFFDAQTNHARYVGTVFVILAGSTLVVLLAALLVAPWVSGWTQMSRLWLGLGVLAAAAQFTINIRLVMWQVRGQALSYGGFQVTQTAFNLCLSLLLVIVAGMGWEGRLAGLLVALLAFATLGLITLHRSAQVAWCFDRGYAKNALRFGVPLIPHAIGSLCIAASDKLMVASLMSVHDTGIYAAGMQIGLVISVLSDAAAKAVGPWLYANLPRDDEAIKRKIVRLTYVFFIGIATTAIAFAAVAPYLLLLVGEQFRSSQAIVAYVALGGAFAGMYLMVVTYIFYVNRNELLSFASLAVGALSLVLAYFLIGRNGAVGAAQAYALSQAVLFLIVWTIAAKVHPMPWTTAFRPAGARPLST
jgi:O-antigen/teichoic acid export membrane protein